MRIAIVNWTNRRVGGAETYLARLIPGLQATHHHLFLWHETAEPASREPIPGTAGLPSCCANDVGVDNALRALKAWQPDVLYVHGLTNPVNEKALLAIAPAVLFAHGYYGTCITGSKTFKLPVVQPCGRQFGTSCLALYYPRRCGGLSPLTMMIDYRRQAARHALVHRYSAVLTFSEHMRREYAQHGVSSGKLHRVPSLDDAAASQSGSSSFPARVPDAVGPTTWRLAFIGRMDPLKGSRLLLKALPRVRAAITGRIVLTFAGDGHDLEPCRREAARIVSSLADTEVEFLGWVPPERCRALLAASDVLVVPSLWPEPHGLVGLEALRAGVPIAAFAVGGIPEWLEDGKTGALAPADPPTAEGLSSAIIRCLTTPAIRTSNPREGRHRAQASIAQHLEALMPLLEGAAAAEASVVA
jgi:glycosyltransferase involved in cell wall biosynthesis